MIRALLAILLLCGGAVLAFGRPLHGGAAPPSGCTYNGSSVNSCILGTDTTDTFIVNQIGFAGATWQYTVANTLHNSNDGGSYPSSRAVLCDPTHYYNAVSWLTAQVASTGYFPWYENSGYEANSQIPTSCTPPTPSLNYFKDPTTTGTCIAGQNFCYTIAALLGNAANGDSLTINAAPSPIPFWVENHLSTQAGTITANNVTLTFGAGATMGYTSNNLGKAAIEVVGTGVTINGGTIEHVPSNTNAACIRVDNGATNFAINGLNCSYSDDCILGGDASVGTFSIINAVMFNCGGDGGQDHLVYIGANINGTDQGPATITNDLFYNVLQGGWNFKDRLGSGHLTNSFFGCLSTGAGCEQNGAIDLPCGGNQLVDFSVIERGPGGDNWYHIRFGEELSINQSGGHGGDDGCVFSAQVTGTEATSNPSQFTGIASDPHLAGVVAGQYVADNGGTFSTVVSGTTVVSIAGSSGAYIINLTCSVAPNCITANNASHTLIFNAQYAVATGNISGSGATQITGLPFDPRGYMAVGEALTGPGLPGGVTISSMTASTISFTGGTATGAETAQTYSATYVNNIVVDHNYIIWDGTINGAEGVPSVCMGAHTGNPPICNQGSWAGGTASNNVYVGDTANGVTCSSDFGGSGNLYIGAGMTNTSNTCYNSRALAGAALGWPGTDAFGNTCCAFPYVPPYLTRDFKPSPSAVFMMALMNAAGAPGFM